jgi:hypothetical protein
VQRGRKWSARRTNIADPFLELVHAIGEAANHTFGAQEAQRGAPIGMMKAASSFFLRKVTLN